MAIIEYVFISVIVSSFSLLALSYILPWIYNSIKNGFSLPEKKKPEYRPPPVKPVLKERPKIKSSDLAWLDDLTEF